MIKLNTNYLIMENQPLMYPGLEYDQKFIYQAKRANNLLSTYMQMNDDIVEFLLKFEEFDDSDKDTLYEFHQDLVNCLCFFLVNFYSYYKLDMDSEFLLSNFGKFLDDRLNLALRLNDLMVDCFFSDYDDHKKKELESAASAVTAVMIDVDNISKIPKDTKEILSYTLGAISVIDEVDYIKGMMVYWNNLLDHLDKLMKNIGFCVSYWKFPEFNPVYTDIIQQDKISVENISKYGAGLSLDYDYRHYVPQLDRAMDLLVAKSEIVRLMIILNKLDSDSYSYGENSEIFNDVVTVLQRVLKPAIKTIIKHLALYVFDEDASIKMLETLSLIDANLENKKDGLEIDKELDGENSNLGFTSFSLFEQSKIILSELERRGNKERYTGEVKDIIKYWNPTMFPLKHSKNLFSKKDYFTPNVASILDCHQLITKILEDLYFTMELFGYKDGQWDLTVYPMVALKQL